MGKVLREKQETHARSKQVNVPTGWGVVCARQKWVVCARQTLVVCARYFCVILSLYLCNMILLVAFS